MAYKVTKAELLKACFGGGTPPEANIDIILKAVNIVRDAYGKPLIPSCYYRTVEWDKKKGRSGNSMHCQGKAVDFNDPKGEFALWCMNNLAILKQAGLWLENPQKTIGWVHLDLKTRQNIIFNP